MFLQIPDKASKKWTASQLGDLFGNISRSRALDFDKKGYLSLAAKPMVLYSESDNANFDTIVCILSDDTNVFVITTDDAWSLSFSSSGFSAGAITGGSPPTFSFNSDAVFYQGTLHASGTTSLRDFSAGSWTSRVTGLSSSYPHPLCVSEHQQYIAVGNGSTVRLYNSSYSLVTTLTVPSDQIVEWIRWRNNQLYIGTRNITGGSCRLYLWNGSGTAAQQGFGWPCDWLYSGCEFNNAMVVVTSNGQILQFSGGGFSELANFPVYYSKKKWNSSASTSNLMGRVASRGMIAEGKKLYINVDATLYGVSNGESDHLINFPSGIWVLDLDVGLYHKAGYGNRTYQSVVGSAVASNILTIPAAIFETGDPVMFSSVSLLTGLDDGRIYYAIKVSSTQIKFAYTAAEALAGSAITIGGTGGSNVLIFNRYRSVGAIHAQRSGGIDLFTRIAPNPYYASEIIWGGSVNDNLGNELTYIMSFGMGRNVGSITTPKIEASEVEDNFKKIVAKFPYFSLATQNLLVKYKLEDRFSFPVNGAIQTAGYATWINSTSFTVDPIYYETGNIQEGDEIEFIEGAAAGYTAHISTIVRSTLVTITIDEAMPDVAASDTSNFSVDNFVKYKTISTADDAKAAAQGIKDMMLGKKSKQLILKFELRGWTGLSNVGTRLEEVVVLTAGDQKYD